ncbi:MAG: transposase [Thainema sp.]
MRLSAEGNRNCGARPPWAKAQIEHHIEWLSQEVKQLDEQIQEQLNQSQHWQQQQALLQSIPGVGLVASTTLIAILPKLEQLTRQQIAALVGVAPINCDSLSWVALDGALSLVYGCSGRYPVQSVDAAFYRRLLAYGKPKKVALVACMCKLLVILNTMFKHNQPWQPPTVQST